MQTNPTKQLDVNDGKDLTKLKTSETEGNEYHQSKVNSNDQQISIWRLLLILH